MSTTMSITDDAPARNSNRHLPQKIRKISEGGAAWETLGYPSKFAARKAVLYAMKVRGWTFNEACHYILDDQTRPVWELWGSGKTDIGRAGRLKRLSRDWNQLGGFSPLVSDRADVLAVCGELRALVDSHHWPGQAGRTDRAVYEVALGFAEQSASLTVRLAEREVSLRAGITVKTARASLRRLVKNNLLQHVNEELEHGQAARYTLQKTELQDYPILRPKTYSESEYGVKLQLSRATLTGDRFGVGIGKAALDVFLVLGYGPLTAVRVAELAGVHKSTAGRHLKMLAREGFAVKTAEGWIRGEADITDYEPPVDRVKERAAQYDRERTAYYSPPAREPEQRNCRECGAFAGDRLAGVGLLCNGCRDEFLSIGRDAAL